MLEIGAVNGQLAVCPWMDTRAIDLRSRDPRVEQCDVSAHRGVLYDIRPAGDSARMFFCQKRTFELFSILNFLLGCGCVCRSTLQFFDVKVLDVHPTGQGVDGE